MTAEKWPLALVQWKSWIKLDMDASMECWRGIKQDGVCEEIRGRWEKTDIEHKASFLKLCFFFLKNRTLVYCCLCGHCQTPPEFLWETSWSYEIQITQITKSNHMLPSFYSDYKVKLKLFKYKIHPQISLTSKSQLYPG